MSESRTKFFFSLCATSKGDESRRDATRRDPFGNTVHGQRQRAALLGWQSSTLLWLRRKRTASASLPSLWAVGQLGKSWLKSCRYFFSPSFFFTFYLRAARARVWKMSENCADNKKRRLWPVGGKWQVAGGNDCWLDEAGRDIINSGICKRKVPKKLLNI